MAPFCGHRAPTVPAARGTMNGMNASDASAQRAAIHVLDVREDDEWQAGHIAGAQHIPLGQLGERVGELPKGSRIVAVCRSGGRSGTAGRGLKQRGYDAGDLDGGGTAWAKAVSRW